VKLDVDTVPTVPDAPPEAGPDRALDPPPPVTPVLDGAVLDGVVLVGVVLVGVVLDDADDEPQAASATTAINIPARTAIPAFTNRSLTGPRRTVESRRSTPPRERSAPLSGCTAPSRGVIVARRISFGVFVVMLVVNPQSCSSSGVSLGASCGPRVTIEPTHCS
jgi:hypothetical protein